MNTGESTYISKLRIAQLVVAAFLVFSLAASVHAQSFDTLQQILQILKQKNVISDAEYQKLQDRAVQEQRSLQEAAKAGKAAGQTKVSAPDWIKRLQLKSDLRLRGEVQEFDTLAESRSRYRVRFRLGGKYSFNKYPFDINFRLATGGAGPTSTNQTFDVEFSTKVFEIDRIYVTYTPSKQFGWKNSSVKLHGGKMANPMWRSELTWDSDVTPEGFAEQFAFKVSPRSTLGFNLGQFAIEERSGGADAEDTWVYTGQAGIQVKHKSVSYSLRGRRPHLR